jgi:hypothetical protein
VEEGGWRTADVETAELSCVGVVDSVTLLIEEDDELDVIVLGEFVETLFSICTVDEVDGDGGTNVTTSVVFGDSVKVT